MRNEEANDLHTFLSTHDIKDKSIFEIYNIWNDSSRYVISLKDIDIATKIIKLYAKNNNLSINFN